MDILKVDGGPLYQWDKGRRLKIFPVQNCTIEKVHFVNPDSDTAMVVKVVTEGGRMFAPIPNILLTYQWDIKAYAVMTTAEGDVTVCKDMFNVRKRQKPADYIYTETEVISIESMVEKALNEAVARMEVTVPTEGLAYELSSDGTYAICKGIGTATETDIIIAKEYKGVPVTDIGNRISSPSINGFSECTIPIESVTIPNSVKNINMSAFFGNEYLKTVILGNSVENINTYAFAECPKIKEMYIPESVKSIDGEAFAYSNDLTDIYAAFDEGKVTGEPWGALYAIVHYNISDFVEKFDKEKVTVMSVLDKDRIRDYKFSDYWFSEKNWKKFIGENNRAYVELYGDRGTTNMYALRETAQPLYNHFYSQREWQERFEKEHPGESFRAPYDNEYPLLDSIAQRDGEGHLNVPLTPSSPNHAVPYSYVSKLEERLLALETELYEGTKGLEYSSDGKYYICTGLGTAPENTDIKIATYIDGIPVESILSYAFGSKTLESVTIPVTLRAMEERAFNGAKVKKVYIRDLVAWCQISFGGINASPITEYNNATVYVNRKPITELVIPNTVTTIRTRTFAYWEQITSLKLPDYLTGISSLAFNGCVGLKEIVLPESLQWTEASAFGKCYGLEKVVFKGRPTSTVHARLFEDCYNLTDIYVPWSEGSVANENVKWGANNATIHYNSEV